MRDCPKAGCGAAIGADGYCIRCGTATKQPATPATSLPVVTPPLVTSRLRSGSLATVRGPVVGSRTGGLVSLPPVPAGDLVAPLLDDPQVREDKRFCPNPGCRQPVGRARPGRPGRPEGLCARCGPEFPFRPPLAPGLSVGDDQFQVKGAIAHGGLGWVYLAWDRRVGHWVVLKGLIDPDDPDKRQAAVAELAALADAQHPNIVTVHTVVTHRHPRTGRDIDYIVMEYLHGPSLKQLHQQHREDDAYLPVEQVCSFALEVLEALGHLHDLGLLYCDVSADNVIHSAAGVKLIDLGAVRRVDDQSGSMWGKPGYQDPQITTNGPSVGTDLYAVGRMMAALSLSFPGFATNAPIPGPVEVELLARHPSFYGLLRRATHPDPHRRFATARDMAEQVEAVLREVRALREDRQFPAASMRFGPELRVVGADPALFPAGEPGPAEAALALPDPQVDPTDPHAGLLATIGAESPDEIERVLAALPDPSLGTRLRVVRARIELRDPKAAAELDTLEQQQPGDWRIDWFRGLASLVAGDTEAARERFTAVLDALPGEVAPKLALAGCAQRDGAAGLAAHLYGTVWRTDQSYVSAAFGLARACFALGDHAAMAAALEAVPDSSRYGVTGRLCAILAWCRGHPDGQAPAPDFFTAAEQLSTLDLDDRRRAHAIAEVLETVLGWERAGRPWPHAAAPIPATLLDHPLDQHGIRDGLEAAYRQLARLAPTTSERIALVDKANDRRNRSWT